MIRFNPAADLETNLWQRRRGCFCTIIVIVHTPHCCFWCIFAQRSLVWVVLVIYFFVVSWVGFFKSWKNEIQKCNDTAMEETQHKIWFVLMLLLDRHTETDWETRTCSPVQTETVPTLGPNHPQGWDEEEEEEQSTSTWSRWSVAGSDAVTWPVTGSVVRVDQQEV